MNSTEAPDPVTDYQQRREASRLRVPDTFPPEEDGSLEIGDTWMQAEHLLSGAADRLEACAKQIEFDVEQKMIKATVGGARASFADLREIRDASLVAGRLHERARTIRALRGS